MSLEFTRTHASEYKTQSKKNQSYGYLTDYSPTDKPWDIHRGQVDAVGGIYARALEFERLAARMSECSGSLSFNWSDDQSTGETRLKLTKAQFCRVRYCPICQWRRSLMWQARFYQALPAITAAYPKARWLFLTLTIQNCEITDLSQTLKTMNQAWKRLIDRQELKPIQGWLRTTEVTRGQDRSAHPHFHVLLMVSPSWFKGQNYVKQSRWVELWRDALRANYLPNVDIRTVKAKGTNSTDDVATLLKDAVAETLKYSTKPADMTTDPQWFLELTKQTHKKRFMASGGVLKDLLREDQETNDDLIHADGTDLSEPVDSSVTLNFQWVKPVKRYQRAV